MIRHDSNISTGETKNTKDKVIKMNKKRFWTGVGMFGSEALAAVIYVLTLIKWDWLNSRVLMMSLGALAFLLWNGLAMILVWNGSDKNKNGKK